MHLVAFEQSLTLNNSTGVLFFFMLSQSLLFLALCIYLPLIGCCVSLGYETSLFTVCLKRIDFLDLKEAAAPFETAETLKQFRNLHLGITPETTQTNQGMFFLQLIAIYFYFSFFFVSFVFLVFLAYTTLQTVRHRFNIYAGSCVALALWRGVGHRKLVTRFGVIRRVKWKVWFGFVFLAAYCSPNPSVN